MLFSGRFTCRHMGRVGGKGKGCQPAWEGRGRWLCTLEPLRM